ncbi:hypothetical protein [Photobacterium leiognathi]|uniref:hypothetical protein n=1 Tax=Photobacterium leiognathi TaxID=553611 RepID=UPI00298277B1|nr:hypothetical protein [Photobacterium leiognathi]
MDRFNGEAISLLNAGLVDWNDPYLNKDELLGMYRFAQKEMQSKSEDFMEYKRAEDVFLSCVRVVRCFISEEARKIVINGNDYILDPQVLFDNAKSNYSYMFK